MKRTHWQLGALIAMATLVLLPSLGVSQDQPTPAQAESQKSASDQKPAPEPLPDPTRFEKTILKFEETDRENPPAPGQILFVGSSSIVRWDVKKSFPDLDILNRGFGGSVINDAVHYFDRVVKPYRPRQVVFYSGDNDIGRKRTPEEVLGDFKAFVGKMRAELPGTPLIYITIKPSIKRQAFLDNINKANALIKEECDKNPSLTYVDICELMYDAQGNLNPEVFVSDGLHLSDKGYQLWTERLRPFLSQDQRSARLRTIYDKEHPWTPPATLDEWNREAERIRRQILVANGLWPMPEKTDLGAIVHSPIDRGDYIVEHVIFSSQPGVYVTGNLYRPKTITGKVPGILTPHGHWGNGRFYQAGDKEAEYQIKQGAEQFQNGARFPLQARMAQLARLGCIVFHYDMIGYADSKPLPHRAGFSDANAALWLHNKMGLQTWNSIRALDFLLSLPEVDPERIGVTGASGGGTQTFLLAAIDPRVTVSFPAVMVSTEMQGGCICENADYLRTGINNIAIAALTAPRPMAMSGANDWTIRIETKGFPELRQVYGLYGAADLVHAKCFPQFEHNYNQVAREMMYDWFNAHLKLGKNSPIQEVDFEPLTVEEMTVFNNEHPHPDNALPEAELRAELIKRDQNLLAGLIQNNPERFREVVQGAVDIMLPAVSKETELTTTKLESADKDSSSTEAAKAQRMILSYDRARVPVTLLSPNSSASPMAVILWVDGTGASHLFEENGTIAPTVQSLLNAGYSVASADLFLTGPENKHHSLYSDRFNVRSPGHEPTSDDPEYTGFVYGYNRTPLAERVRDIQAITRALKGMSFEKVILVGTGKAGLWAAISAASASDLPVEQVIADLDGFRFDTIKASADENMLPGALKYGDIEGILSLASPIPLTLAGVKTSDSSEANPLRKAYASTPGKLKLIPESPSPDQLVAPLLAN